jgi:hypothetical protein
MKQLQSNRLIALGIASGEGPSKFGAEWYALSASGRKVEQSQSTGGGYGH